MPSGGPDGEAAASMRYLSQRYSMPYRKIAGLLTDIGSEASEMFRRTHRVYFKGLCFLTSSLRTVRRLQPYNSIYGGINSDIHLCSLCRESPFCQAAVCKIHPRTQSLR